MRKAHETQSPFLKVLRQPSLVAKVLLSSLFVSTLFVTLDSLVSARIERASTEVLFLASELQREVGPHFSDAKQVHARLIDTFKVRMESRTGATAISAIWPKYSPSIQLGPILQKLETSGNSDSSAKCAIEEASEMLVNVGVRWSASRKAVFVIENCGSQGEKMLNGQIATFLESAEKFALESHDNPKERMRLAEIACMDSRLSCALVLSFWSGHSAQTNPYIGKLETKLGELQKALGQFANELDGLDRERIRHYADNVGGRAEILAGLDKGGLSAARQVILASLK